MSLGAEHPPEKTFAALMHIKNSPDTKDKYAVIQRLEWESKNCPKHKVHLHWKKEVHREKSFLHPDTGCSLSPKYNYLPDCHLKTQDFPRFVAAWEQEKNMVKGLEASEYRSRDGGKTEYRDGAGKSAYDRANFLTRQEMQNKDTFGRPAEWSVMHGKRDPSLLKEAGMEGNLFSGMGNNRNMFFNVKKPGD